MAFKINLARRRQGRETGQFSPELRFQKLRRRYACDWLGAMCWPTSGSRLSIAVATCLVAAKLSMPGLAQDPTYLDGNGLPNSPSFSGGPPAAVNVETSLIPSLDRNPPTVVPTGVVVGLPGVLSTTGQSVIVEPSVNLTSPTDVGLAEANGQSWLLQRRPSVNLSGPDQPFVFYQEPLPPPRVNLNGGNDFETVTPLPQGEAEPIFPSITSGLSYAESGTGLRLGEGLGIERLPFGLFDIDSAQPANNFRIRTVFADRMNLPDRASYFWAETGSPAGMPLGESYVDYQELRFRAELGSKKFSTAFEVPFRSSDPVLNENHAGLSDLQLATKVVMLSGQNWLLTQFTGFRFPTGNSGAGLGTGQVGMEPGLLFRSKFRETTWLHGEAKFWFPLGGVPGHPGQVVKLAAGMNTIWRETDRTALIPSLELSSFTVLDGRVRDATQIARDVDGDFIFNVTPGIHYSIDQNGDFGLLDIGASMSFALSNSKFAESMFILESRWFW